MEQRTHANPQPPTPAPCPGCQGAGGRVEDTSGDGVTRQNWRTCTACGGTGRA